MKLKHFGWCLCLCVDANLESHVSHLNNVSEEELNRLLSMVVDVENLFTCVHKEEDVDTKQVYFYLFRVRKYCSTFHCFDAVGYVSGRASGP